jgi:AcrR family transcriptional regulator
MVETRPRDGAKTRAEIREAAAKLFYLHGYEATALRAVAAEVGIKVGSLYNHMGSKEELLQDIMTTVMRDILSDVESAVSAAGEDPLARLEAAVGAHIRFHAQHARETFIGNSELRALPPKQRKTITKWRKNYEEYLRDLVVAASDAQGVKLLDERLQTYAILALGMHVASWFRQPGEVSLDHVVDVYTELTLRQIGVPSAVDRAAAALPRRTKPRRTRAS